MNQSLDDIKNHLPSYLSPAQKEELLEQIKNFPKINHYIAKYPEEILQGDAWTGFTIIDFHSCEKQLLKGIVISNSCDIDLDNPRHLDVNIIFAPLVKLSRYQALLHESGIEPEKVADKIQAIKQQRITSMMYFPKGGELDDDYVVNFDDIHSQPLRFFSEQEKRKLFTLSQAGFYLFVLKMSIHFCRFQEEIERYD